MGLCPSQNEEMIQIGALCYGSIFMFRDDLKQVIFSHQQWTPLDPASPPIFDIYVGKLNTPEKRNRNALCIRQAFEAGRSLQSF